MNKLICNDYDSTEPQRVHTADGEDYGTLMPRASLEVLRASPGIQSWSRPVEDDYDEIQEQLTCSLCKCNQLRADAFLGKIGNLEHYRCRHCGIGWHE